MSEFLKITKELKYKLVNSLDFAQSNINEEVVFIDDVYIEKILKRFTKEYNSISMEIKKILQYSKRDEYSTKKINELLLKQDELVIKSMFIITNDEQYVDRAVKALDKIKRNVDYKKGLEAVLRYKEGKQYESELLFKEYYSNLNKLPNHYLINKIYAEIMIKKKEYKIAIDLLRKSIEIRPDDIELHIKINKIYKYLNMNKEMEVENVIIKLLGGENNV